MAADTASAPQLTCDDLLQLQPSQQACPDRFRPLFPRRDQAASFGAYAEGLLSGEQRKSVRVNAKSVSEQCRGQDPGRVFQPASHGQRPAPARFTLPARLCVCPGKPVERMVLRQPVAT